MIAMKIMNPFPPPNKQRQNNTAQIALCHENVVIKRCNPDLILLMCGWELYPFNFFWKKKMTLKFCLKFTGKSLYKIFMKKNPCKI